MTTSDPCICAACQPDYRLMRVCGTCGYKRCPGAADHRNTCTGSNEPGQPGSLYADPPTHQEPDMTATDRHDELVALLTEIRDRLPEPEGVNAVEPAPTDITEEPPRGSQVTDRGGDIWERRDKGWALWWPDRSRWLAEGELDLWPTVRDQAPLRPTTDADRARVGLPLRPGTCDGCGNPIPVARCVCATCDHDNSTKPAPADDGLAEWERELLRPATCCGKCPPIAGGGYDCTCEGNPRCSAWEPAPDDADEALAEAEGRIADLECRAKRAEADVADMIRQRDKCATLAEKWQARHAALRADVEGVVALFADHPTMAVHPKHVVRRIEWAVLARDDERGGQE